MTINIESFHKNVTCKFFGHDWEPAGKVLMVCTRCKTDNAPIVIEADPANYPNGHMGPVTISVLNGTPRCGYSWRRYGGSGPWTRCNHSNFPHPRHEDGNGSWVSQGAERSVPHEWVIDRRN